MKRLVVLSLIGIIVSSCTSQGKRENSYHSPNEAQPFLFEMQHFFTQTENFMSLPVWFDTDQILNKSIFRITRSIYHVSVNTADETDSAELDLREVRDYYFNRSGQLDSLRIDYYYDDHKIGIVSFYYPGEQDQYGFHKKVERNLRIPGEGGLTPQELPFLLFSQSWSSRKSLTYRDQERWTKYHFMLSDKDFGPLSVDSVIHPGQDDYVILGSPKRPEKMYQVINKVHERNVHLYTYLDGNGPLETYTRSEYPFDVKRTVLYDGKGKCTGYVDSTFSGKTFLSRTEGKFKMNNKELPVKLERLKENQQSATCLVSVEKYNYEHY